MKNSGDNVFGTIPVSPDEATFLSRFLTAHDLAVESRRAMVDNVRKFARWFTETNQEPFSVAWMTVRDVRDFKDYLPPFCRSISSSRDSAKLKTQSSTGWMASSCQTSIPSPVKPL